jgi:hypothetical protein
VVNAALDSEVETLGCDDGTIRGWARWASASGSTRSARATGAAACRHISDVGVGVQRESVASTTILQSVVGAGEAAVTGGRDLCRCVDGVTAVAFGRVLSAEVLVAGAVVGTPVQSHEGSRREFAAKCARASIGVAVGIEEGSHLLR